MKTKRIALIIPHSDTTLETDLQRELPSNYVLHTQRIWLDEVGKEAEKRMVDIELSKAINYLKGITDFDCVIFGCTSASAVYGEEGLYRLENFISNQLDCKGISAFGAVLEQLKQRNKRNISLVTPYTKTVNEFMVNSLKEFGVHVTYHTGLNITDDVEIAKVRIKQIKDKIMNEKDEIIRRSELLFISCTNFRAMEVYKEIQKQINMDTITTNQSIVDWIKSEMK